MTKHIKTVLCLVLSFSFAILNIGYAAVSDTLTVNGSANTAPQTGIFLTAAEVLTEGTGSAEVHFLRGTNLSSTVTLANSSDSTVSIRLTFYNSYDERYDYAGVNYLDEAYSNSRITFTVHDFTGGTLYAVPRIEPKKTLTCTITFSYDSYISGQNILESLLNFNFAKSTNENISVVEGIDTNNLATVSDGKVVFSNNNAERWTNWTENSSDRGKPSTLAIMQDGNEFTFDTLVLHHFIDTGGCDVPEAVRVYYYDESVEDYVLLFEDARTTLNYSGDGFTKSSNYRSITRSSGTTGIATIRFTDNTSGTVDWRYTGKMPATTYELDSSITTRGLKIEIDAKANWFIGLTELEIYNGSDNILN